MSLPQWAINEKKEIEKVKDFVVKLKEEADKSGITEAFEIDLATHIVHLLNGLEYRVVLRILSYVGSGFFDNLTPEKKVGSLAETYERAYKKRNSNQ